MMMTMNNVQRRLLTRVVARRPVTAAAAAATSTTMVDAGKRSYQTTDGRRRQDERRLSDVLTSVNEDDVRGGDHMVYSLSFATLDEYNPFPQLTRPLFARENEQLRISLDQLRYRTIATRAALRDQSSSAIGYELPRTLDDALRPSSRAVVITERNMPFNVVNVNKAWEELCGYTFTECHGRSLGSLIKGPKTDPVVVTALINQLLKGEVAAAVITNYKKNGQPFRNRLRVGPLYSNNDRNKEEVSHFVGILEEIAA